MSLRELSAELQVPQAEVEEQLAALGEVVPSSEDLCALVTLCFALMLSICLLSPFAWQRDSAVLAVRLHV